MTNSMLDARQKIQDALAPIMLEGRMQPYKPTQVSPPQMWIDRWRIENVSDVIRVRFTVIGVVDGADHSQIAVLDDMVARAWDAVRAVAGPKNREARSATVPFETQPGITAPGRAMRGFELDIEVPIRSLTLCHPTAEPVTVPPTEYAEVS